LAPVERPLVARVPTREWKPKPYPLKHGRVATDLEPVLPGDMDVERLVGGPKTEGELLVGDLLNSVGPLYPQAWMESTIGCPINVSAYSCVARPAGVDLGRASEDFTVDQALASEWAGVMDRMLERAVDLAQGRLPVRQLHLRGIIDMLAAYLGEETLCMAVYDAPVALARLRDKFAELYIAVARRGLDVRVPWKGGFVSSWSLYAPGPLLDYQIDASSLFSPRVYEEYFLDVDRKVLASFPYSIVHLHACGLYLLDVVLKIEELGAVEINLDRETGAWEAEQILAYCRKVQAHGKGLLINGELTEEEAHDLVSALSPRGLALYYWNP
jgi:hypothetical protein